MSVQRRVAAVDCQGLVEQLSMQCFIQEGRWHLDKQMSDFFHFFGLLVSYRTLVHYATAPQGAGSRWSDVLRHRKNS